MGTVSKALELLDLFRRDRPLIGLSEMARLAGLNKATCHRLLVELCEHGLVEQVGAAREYRLGPALLRLASLREAQVPTREAAMPILQALAQATGETAHLSLMVSGGLRSLAFAYSTAHATRVTLEDTDELPFHATSSGLAVLAFLPEAQAGAILAGPLPALTLRTLTDPGALRDRLAKVRLNGFAESAGGYESDVVSVAVPLFGADGTVTGALAVAALAARMTPARSPQIRAALVRAGSEITRLWGGGLPPALQTLWRQTA